MDVDDPERMEPDMPRVDPPELPRPTPAGHAHEADETNEQCPANQEELDRIRAHWLPDMDTDTSEDGDQVSLMAWATNLPPWKRRRNPRDHWMLPSGSNPEHRRRFRDDGRKRWRQPSPARPKKGGKKGLPRKRDQKKPEPPSSCT